MSRSFLLSPLYAILDLSYVTPGAITTAARELLAGGVRIFQLRGKTQTPQELLAIAREVGPVVQQAGALFLINDHVEVAAQAGADGVHVGQDDWSVAKAREVLGPGPIIGKSTHSLEQAVAAQEEGADYIGLGPIFATPTKPGRPPIGLEVIGQVQSRVRVPVFCIGGINAGTLPQVLAAGARQVVMVSALLQAQNRVEYAQKALGELKG